MARASYRVVHCLGSYVWSEEERADLHRALLGRPGLTSHVLAETLASRSGPPPPHVEGKTSSEPRRARRLLARFATNVDLSWRRRWFRTRLEALAPAVVHAHFGECGALLAPVCEALDLPLVVTFYGVDVSASLKSRRWRRPYERMLRVARKLVVLCDEARNRLLAAGAEASQVEVWNCLVDLDRFPYAPRRPEGAVKFITAARFVDKKGYPTLLEAFRRLRSRGVDATLTALGYGPRQAEVRAQARRLGLDGEVAIVDTSSQVDFAGFYREHLLRSDVFVLPSTVAANGDDEGGPALTMIMAQSAGLPVISTPFPGAERSVTEGKTGVYCRADDVQSLEETMFRLAIRPDLWNELGKEGSRLVNEAFRPEHQVERMVQIYEAAVASDS